MEKQNKAFREGQRVFYVCIYGQPEGLNDFEVRECRYIPMMTTTFNLFNTKKDAVKAMREIVKLLD